MNNGIKCFTFLHSADKHFDMLRTINIYKIRKTALHAVVFKTGVETTGVLT